MIETGNVDSSRKAGENKLHGNSLMWSAEIDALSKKVQATQFEARHLRQLLRACGVQDTTLAPTKTKCGACGSLDSSVDEFRNLITWLAQMYDVSRQIVLNVGGEVPVGDCKVILNRMVNWPLLGDLKLSVPYGMEFEIVALLNRTRKGQVAEEEFQQIAQSWDVMGSEAACESGMRPVIFLVHRETRLAAVIGDWPIGVKARERACFDPNEYFSESNFKITASKPPTYMLAHAPAAVQEGKEEPLTWVHIDNTVDNPVWRGLLTLPVTCSSARGTSPRSDLTTSKDASQSSALCEAAIASATQRVTCENDGFSVALESVKGEAADAEHDLSEFRPL